ncbi:MAG: hypothetical protein OXI46_06540, partial [Gemmatimonadota bacterium]|nr:hypothetical protein [Gemmatimonadota bacterium]
RNTRWSPNGSTVAFTHDTDSAVQLWVLDLASAQARRLSDLDLVNVGFGAPFNWSPKGDFLYVRAVPPGRGPAPTEPMVPTAPMIEETSGEAAPARTYQDLLQDRHDEALYEYYLTAQVARIGLDGSVAMLGEPAIFATATPSPAGGHLLVQTTHRPYSYQVPASRFPSTIEVWDAQGNVVHQVAELPLQDGVPTSFGSVPTGVRSVTWRADADATLYWTEAQDGGDALAEADIRDRVYMHAAPFSGEPVEIATLPLRYGGVMWAEAGFALVSENWFSTRQQRTYRIDPDAPGDMDLIFDLQTEDRYNDPGFPMFTTNERGHSVLMTSDGGSSIYLAGQGASPEGNRPFLRKRNLQTGEEEELFRSEAPYYEGDGEGNMFARALEAGAADYIVRPFSPAELAARVALALRRRATLAPFRVDELALDRTKRRVTLAGQAMQLTATEYRLLETLSLEVGGVATTKHKSPVCP